MCIRRLFHPESGTKQNFEIEIYCLEFVIYRPLELPFRESLLAP